MDGKRIQCWSNALQHIPIYLQTFTSYSEILIGNCTFFLPALYLTAPLGVFPQWCSHWNSWKKFGPQKTRIMGLRTCMWRQFDDRLSRFDTIPACDGQTDGQTDRRTDRRTDVQPISITCAVWLTNVKKETLYFWRIYFSNRLHIDSLAMCYTCFYVRQLCWST